MRIITTILLLICFNANATIYYIDNAGSDAANGTSTGTAWQTIAKVNAQSFSPGDQILFKKGGSWNERLNPPSSGTAGNVITFGAYGIGLQPVITGFQTLTGWTNNGNIWSSTFSSSVRYQNTVYINGGLRAKGRYPNYGWLNITSHVGNNQLTGSLTGTPNYTGGEIIIRTNHWTIDNAFITSQSSGVINFSPATYYSITNNNGYFIQNITSVLDTLNEWSYDTLTKIIKVYQTSQPVAKASSIDTLVNVLNKNYITFDAINFEGANLAAIYVTGSNNITITNCNISNSGANAIRGWSSNYLNVSNCVINNSWNGGIIITPVSGGAPDSDNSIIYNNTISNTGKSTGMGASQWLSHTGIMMFGDKCIVGNNVIDSTGYIGIQFFGDSITIKNNYINNFCFTKDDGGGIYTWMGAVRKKGCIVRSNIVTNGLTATDGNYETSAATSGIYMDNNTKDVIIDSNTVSSCSMAGIFLHIADNITVKNNVMVSNAINFRIEFGDSTIFKNNILYSATTPLLRSRGIYFQTIDSNYYLNAGDTNSTIFIFTPYSLKRWQDSGYDIHSKRFPSGITSASPLLKYNRTNTSVTQNLIGTYIDSKGNSYTNAISLQPFQSALLFKAVVDYVAPNIFVPGKINKRMKFKKIRLR